MIIPVVTGDIDAGAVEELIALCVRYHRLRTRPRPGPRARQQSGSDGSPGGDGSAAVPAGLIGSAARQAQAALVPLRWPSWSTRSWQGPAGRLRPGRGRVFLRRQLLGKGLNGPSLPLDVGQTDDIPVHLRRLVALRDQTCQHPGGYFLYTHINRAGRRRLTPMPGS